MAENNYDAIVIGSGISGGWAAKELCEKGLKVLLLERGKDVKHVVDYVNAGKGPWEFAHHGNMTLAQKKRTPTVSGGLVPVRSTSTGGPMTARHLIPKSSNSTGSVAIR